MTKRMRKEKAAPPQRPATREVPIVLPTSSLKCRGAICEAKDIACAGKCMLVNISSFSRGLTGDDSAGEGHSSHDYYVNPVRVENDAGASIGRDDVTQGKEEDEAEADDRSGQQFHRLNLRIFQ